MRYHLMALLVLVAPVAAVSAEDAPAPAVFLKLGARQASAEPLRQGFTHTGGGNIDVAQPTPDTVVITMTGVAVAGADPCKASHATLNFSLDQGFDVVFDNPEVKRAKLTLEARVIGLLRSHAKGGGSAQQGPGHAVVSCGPLVLAAVDVAPHAVANGQNLSVNDRPCPVAALVGPGCHHLQMTWSVSAAHPRSWKLCKASSSEFAPDPALDPLWISYWEPFHGASKKDFGFQVTIKVAPDAEVKPQLPTKP